MASVGCNTCESKTPYSSLLAIDYNDRSGACTCHRLIVGTTDLCLKYHLANSLMSTLLGAGQFFPRHSEAGTPCIDIKLRGPGQHFWERRGLQPLSKPVGRVGHPHYSLIQGLLLVLFVPVTRHCVSGDTHWTAYRPGTQFGCGACL